MKLNVYNSINESRRNVFFIIEAKPGGIGSVICLSNQRLIQKHLATLGGLVYVLKHKGAPIIIDNYFKLYRQFEQGNVVTIAVIDPGQPINNATQYHIIKTPLISKL